MKFLVYDITFLVLFSIFIGIFLYVKRKNLKREGLFFLYKTQIGVKALHYIGNNYKKTLDILKNVIIVGGLILMVSILYVFLKSVYIYITIPQITEIIKAPPIAPLIPYFPQLFGMESFFPPFYFTYFLIALILVAVVHEFSHGIYMARFKVKIKSTGFVFLGPILGAFVEQDDKQLVKKKPSEQMVILGAGPFSNLVLAFIFFLIFMAFFYISLEPKGYMFNTYTLLSLPLSLVSNISTSGNWTELNVGNNIYFVENEFLKKQLALNLKNITVYDDTPAFRANLKGIIVSINEMPVTGRESLGKALANFKPGDEVEIKTMNEKNGINSYKIKLSTHPENQSMAYLGIGFMPTAKGMLTSLNLKEESTYYKPRFDGDLILFVYDLLWWIIIINFLVALFNMLPLGPLDGGRFFYLCILSITKSENIAKRLFNIVSYAIFFIFGLMMFFWAIRVF